MEALFVVPRGLLIDFSLRLTEALEGVLPNTLLFETTEEAFDHAILFRHVGRNELMTKSVIPTGCSKATTLERQAVVRAHHELGSLWTKSPKAPQTLSLHRPLRLPSTASSCKLLPHDLSVMAIDDGGEMSPPISSTSDMRRVGRPTEIARHHHPNARARHRTPLAHEPVLQAQQDPNPAISKNWILLDQRWIRAAKSFSQHALAATRAKGRERLNATRPRHDRSCAKRLSGERPSLAGRPPIPRAVGLRSLPQDVVVVLSYNTRLS